MFGGLSAPAALAQEVFSDDFEDRSICAWANADQTDNDLDNYPLCAFDCEDSEPTINPGQMDGCGDGVDNDCTGFADEACCHPLLQNCGGDDACYYNIFTNGFACGAPFGEPPGQQEDPCQFVNACDEGFGCTLCTPPICDIQTDMICARFCELGGDDCDFAETCLRYDQWWGDLEPAPDDFGMCVPNEFLI